MWLLNQPIVMLRNPQLSHRILLALGVLISLAVSVLDSKAEATPKEAPEDAGAAATARDLPMTAALKRAPAADFEATFLGLMIHRDMMSERLWSIAHERATDDTIRTMENRMTKKVKIEIEQMNAWLKKYHGKTPDDIVAPAESTAALALDVEELTKSKPTEFNARFAQKISGPLLDAAAMGRLAVQKAVHPEVKELARTIAIGHTKDHKKLQGIAKMIK